MNKYLKILLKVLSIICISILIGTFLMFLIYSIPIDRVLKNVINSNNVFGENIVKQWAGWTRYSHISNTSDFTMINEAICRPYSSTLINALLNPRYSDINAFSISTNGIIENFPRYWHGYLLYIIPLLNLTDIGGIRMILLIIQFSLTIIAINEFGKKDRLLTYIFGSTLLFINPITTAISFEDADIYIIMLIFTIVILKYNDWLTKKDRYILLFTLNGIFVAFFDFLTYPLVAWGIPLATFIVINKNDIKTDIKNIVFLSLSWIAGYALMWFGKWIVADIFTDANVISDGFNQVIHRTTGDGYSFIDTLIKNIESIIDTPMLILYLLSIVTIFLFSIKNKKRIAFNKKYLLNIIPLIIIGFAPFVWYFVVRNHSYLHPWFEYRELAVTMYTTLIIISKLFVTKDK